MANFGISAIHPSNSGVHFFGFASAGTGYALVAASGPTVSTALLNVHTDGDIIPGPQTAAALATTATDGFVFLRSCNGTPTGAPTHAGTGRVASVYDYANHRIYINHGGTWRSVAVS